MTESDSIAYGKYVKFLIDLYRNEGMEVLIRFLDYEEEFTCAQALAYLIQYEASK